MGGLLKLLGGIAVVVPLIPIVVPLLAGKQGNFSGLAAMLPTMGVLLPVEIVVLFGLLLMGIGEICDRLSELNRNLTKRGG